MSENMEMTLPSGHKIKGNVNSLGQLSAKFQVWAKNTFGITDSESFCMIMTKEKQQNSEHYKNWFTPQEFDNHLKNGLSKIDWTKLPKEFS
jgi:hypothetical protein